MLLYLKMQESLLGQTGFYEVNQLVLESVDHRVAHYLHVQLLRGGSGGRIRHIHIEGQQQRIGDGHGALALVFIALLAQLRHGGSLHVPQVNVAH